MDTEDIGMQQFAQQQNLIDTRINPEQELQQIENFLRGSKPQVKIDGEGNAQVIQVEMGEQLANPIGVNNIMNALRLRINKMVVQGNFDEKQYFDFVADTRQDITFMIVSNCYKWGISKINDEGQVDDSNLRPIIDNIMAFIEPFMSRLINNEERKSYINQFHSVEKHVVGPQGGGGRTE